MKAGGIGRSETCKANQACHARIHVEEGGNLIRLFSAKGCVRMRPGNQVTCKEYKLDEKRKAYKYNCYCRWSMCNHFSSFSKGEREKYLGEWSRTVLEIYGKNARTNAKITEYRYVRELFFEMEDKKMIYMAIPGLICTVAIFGMITACASRLAFQILANLYDKNNRYRDVERNLGDDSDNAIGRRRDNSQERSKVTTSVSARNLTSTPAKATTVDDSPETRVTRSVSAPSREMFTDVTAEHILSRVSAERTQRSTSDLGPPSPPPIRKRAGQLKTERSQIKSTQIMSSRKKSHGLSKTSKKGTTEKSITGAVTTVTCDQFT